MRQGPTCGAPTQLRVCPHMAPFDLPADPNGFSRAAGDAVGVGRREALGVRQLAAALCFCPKNVSVPISHIPHQSDDRSYDPFRSSKPDDRTYTGWGRARMPALLYALEKPTTVGSAAVLGRISVTTDHTTRFDQANPTTEHIPAGGRQECPRSCTRWRNQRRSGARPSSAASARRPIIRPVSIKQTRRPNIYRLGAGKNARAPARAGETTGGRERGRPRPHQRDTRSYTRFVHSNLAPGS